MSDQKYPAAGGRYVVEKPGAAPKRVEAPQVPADGARARAADGARLNRAAAEPATPAAPVSTTTAGKPAKS